MKKSILIFSLALIILFASACTSSDDTTSQVSEVVDEIVESQPDAEDEADEVTEEKEIDYTPYVNLVNTYFDVYGELVVEQNHADSDINTAGFNYAELIDLDNDGVLELILVGVLDDVNAIESGLGAVDLYFDDTFNLKELVEIYTLSDTGVAVLLDKQTLSSYGNGGVEFGVEYAKETENTYVLNSFRSDIERVTYYELSNGRLKESLSYELIYDYDNSEYIAVLNDQKSDVTAIEDAVAAKGEVIVHRLSWLTQSELDELMARNEETFSFLEKYAPITR